MLRTTLRAQAENPTTWILERGCSCALVPAQSRQLHRLWPSRLLVLQDGAQLGEENEEYYRRLRAAAPRVDSDIGDEAAGEQRRVMAQQAVQARTAQAERVRRENHALRQRIGNVTCLTDNDIGDELDIMQVRASSMSIFPGSALSHLPGAVSIACMSMASARAEEDGTVWA